MKRAVIALVAILACALVVYAGQITPNGANQSDVYQLMSELVYAVNNKCLTTPTLAINAGAKEKFDTTANFTAVNSGVLNAVTASAAQTFTAPVTTIPASKRAIFAIGVKADDSVVTKQSRVVDFDNQLVIPKFPEGTAIIGTIKVVTAADGQFVPNTTLLDDASCTITITNMHSLPLSLDVKAR